jgi:hypothetical protein
VIIDADAVWCLVIEKSRDAFTGGHQDLPTMCF